MNEPILSVILIVVAISQIFFGYIVSKAGTGYNGIGRTTKSPEARAFAAKQMGGKTMLFSIVSVVPMIVVSVLAIVLSENEALYNVFLGIRIALLAIPAVLALIMAELSVRRHFDKNGKRYK